MQCTYKFDVFIAMLLLVLTRKRLVVLFELCDRNGLGCRYLKSPGHYIDVSENIFCWEARPNTAISFLRAIASYKF